MIVRFTIKEAFPNSGETREDRECLYDEVETVRFSTINLYMQFKDSREHIISLSRIESIIEVGESEL